MTTTTTPTIEELKKGQKIKSWSRWTGTGYRSEVWSYQNKTFQVDYNCHGQEGFWDNIFEIKDPRPGQKKYAAQCRMAAQKEGIYLETALAVGPENVKYVAEVLENLPQDLKKEYVLCQVENIPLELECGIGRRKRSLKKIFPLMEGIIDQMGQLNSSRLAGEVIEQLKNTVKDREIALYSYVKDKSVGMVPSSIEDGCAVWSF